MHLNANPTQGELLHHEFKQRKEELKDTSRVSILAKYGGAEYLETAPKELREGQTEDYVEYSRTGQVIMGRERAKAKSKYPEDGKYCKVQVVISLIVLQYLSTTTPLYGGRGMTALPVLGVTPVVIPSSTFHTVLAWLVLRLPKRPPHKVYFCQHRHQWNRAPTRR